MNQIEAPWTDEQVENLNDWQYYGMMHPFTCPVNHGKDHTILIATNAGWKCPYCSYRQNWAHDFMFEGAHEWLRTKRTLEEKFGVSNAN